MQEGGSQTISGLSLRPQLLVRDEPPQPASGTWSFLGVLTLQHMPALKGQAMGAARLNPTPQEPSQ